MSNMSFKTCKMHLRADLMKENIYVDKFEFMMSNYDIIILLITIQWINIIKST